MFNQVPTFNTNLNFFLELVTQTEVLVVNKLVHSLQLYQRNIDRAGQALRAQQELDKGL